MQYYVAAAVANSGDGTRQRPFKTIQEAARIAQPGDEVIVAPGVYREAVDPRNGEHRRRPSCTVRRKRERR